MKVVSQTLFTVFKAFERFSSLALFLVVTKRGYGGSASFVLYCNSAVIVCIIFHTDTRKDLCFLQYRYGQCSSPSPMLATKSGCCCAVPSMDAPGTAWGAGCEPCPVMTDPEYKKLCRHGEGMDHNGAGE